jgi:hypothetical protein
MKEGDVVYPQNCLNVKYLGHRSEQRGPNGYVADTERDRRDYRNALH